MIDVQHGWTQIARDHLRQSEKVRIIVQAPSTAVLHLYAEFGAPLAIVVIRAHWAGPASTAPSNRGPIDTAGPIEAGSWREVSDDLDTGDELVLQYGPSARLSVTRLNDSAVLNTYAL